MTDRPAKVRKTHNQITGALKKEAKSRGLQPNTVYNQFFREVFLNELMQADAGWVLKGGTNVYCRIPVARQTKDLDLYRHVDPTSALSAAEFLVEVMNGHQAGPYTFDLERTFRKTMAGPVENERVTVAVLRGAGNEFAEFNIDVSGDLEVSGSVDEVTVKASFDLVTDFFPNAFQVTSYPVENQIADKVAAMYDRYGETPPGKASTRYHDFFDIALMASKLSVAADSLRRALEQQCKLRGVDLPNQMREPEPGRGYAYERKATKLGWGSEELCAFEGALAIASRLLDPLLAKAPSVHGATWDPVTSSWKVDG